VTSYCDKVDEALDELELLLLPEEPGQAT